MKWKKSQDNWPHFYPSKSELYSVYCIILYSPSCKPLFTKVFVLVALLYTISFFPFSLYLVCLKFFRLQVLFSFCFSEQFDFSFSLLLKLFCWCPASWSEQQWPLWKQTIFQSLLGKEQIEKQYPISSENVWVFFTCWTSIKRNGTLLSISSFSVCHFFSLLPYAAWITLHFWGVSYHTQREQANTVTASNTLKQWKSTEESNYHFICVVRLDGHSPFQLTICLGLKWKSFLLNDALARGSQP